jgi:hypothetical protein
MDEREPLPEHRSQLLIAVTERTISSSSVVARAGALLTPPYMSDMAVPAVWMDGCSH